MATSRAPIAVLAFFALIVACGKDIDIGGAPDASPDVVFGTGQQCEPCESPSDCLASDACGQFAGDAFCARLCPNHNECAVDETCTSIPTTTGAHVDACTPKSGSCEPAPPPMSDGGALTQCGALVGPTVTASCHSCGRFSNDCQANGCYSGWWCNTTTHYCQKPPTTCP